MATSSTDTSEQEKDLKQLSRSVNEYGSDFVDVYYKSFDTKRHEMSKYYTDESKVVWNGNEVDPQNRQKFHLDLPDSKHYIDCFDVHPILSEFSKTGHYMILVSVSGTCRYTGHESKLFFQNFMLAAIESKWKIISDSFRFAE